MDSRGRLSPREHEQQVPRDKAARNDKPRRIYGSSRVTNFAGLEPVFVRVWE